MAAPIPEFIAAEVPVSIICSTNFSCGINEPVRTDVTVVMRKPVAPPSTVGNMILHAWSNTFAVVIVVSPVILSFIEISSTNVQLMI